MNKYFHIYGTLECPHCLEAITLLGSLGYEYVLTIMGQSKTYSMLTKTAYAHNTVPIITYCSGLADEEFIGGADDLIKYLQKTFEEKKKQKDLTDPDE
jgi:glutaredoxin